MSRLLVRLRSLLHGSDAERAARGEAQLVAREAERSSALERKLRAAYSAEGARALTVGRAVGGGWPVRVPVDRLAGHMAIVGPSGAGKSFFITLIILALLRSGARRLLVADPKEETLSLVKRAVVDVASGLPQAEAEDLLGRVVSLNLFSKERLPHLQLLAPVNGLDPELHAYEIANLLTVEADQAAGFRQEAVLHLAVQCLIVARLPLTVLPTVLQEPVLLERLAESCRPADLFRTTAMRIAKESKDRVLGVVARVERLLRLRSTRLALGGSGSCIDFSTLLDNSITLLGTSPPHGSADIGRFTSGGVWMLLAHAILRRPNGAPPVHVIVDEWPTFLAGGGARLADSFEHLLRLARSKGVYLTVLSQDMTSIAKISPSLPEVVKTNMHLFCTFRAHDAAAWDFLLPVTGRRRRAASAPWEEKRAGTLERSAELVLLRDELIKLPDRECYFVDRRTGLPGLLMHTADLMLRATDADVRALEACASVNGCTSTIDELERGERAIEERIRHLRGETPPRPSTDVVPLRRGKRLVEIG